MSLINLQDFNARQAQIRHEEAGARPNGIACPDCNLELVDSQPMYSLASSPPQKEIHCPSCGWKGYRLA
jgi:uncharacterized protein with PIN domain